MQLANAQGLQAYFQVTQLSLGCEIQYVDLHSRGSPCFLRIFVTAARFKRLQCTRRTISPAAFLRLRGLCHLLMTLLPQQQDVQHCYSAYCQVRMGCSLDNAASSLSQWVFMVTRTEPTMKVSQSILDECLLLLAGCLRSLSSLLQALQADDEVLLLLYVVCVEGCDVLHHLSACSSSCS